MTRTLADLQTGQSATVVQVAGEYALRRRLAELGITPGCTVTVNKIAPLGDPMEIKIRGYELVLRKENARNITVLENGKQAE